MKINLPIFKDEDAKDAVTYQSWRWDLAVYQHVQDAGITPSCPMYHKILARLSWRVGTELWY